MAAVPSFLGLSGIATQFSTGWLSDPQTQRCQNINSLNRLHLAGKTRAATSSSDVSENTGRSEKPDDPVFIYNVARRRPQTPSHTLAQPSEARVDNRVGTSNGAVQSENTDASGTKGSQLRAKENTVSVTELETLLTRPPERLVPQVSENHKSGYIALIGQPNAGKSTLLNSLIGQKLSIVTKKPQTTRHRILGLCSAPDYQIILYDTPGVISNRHHLLDDMMMQSVRTATVNADAVVVVVDITQNPLDVRKLLLQGVEEQLSKKPTLIALNKKDMLKPGEVAKKIQLYEEACGSEMTVLPISAKQSTGRDELLQWMLASIPNGPAYYPKDVVSELPERFFAAEIVREKILLQYGQEIPYVTQVNVRTFRERRGAKDYVSVEIFVERESQKAILVGKEGKAMKTLGTSARQEMEEFLGRPVFLEMKVKVKEKWRQDESALREFGLDVTSRGNWY